LIIYSKILKNIFCSNTWMRKILVIYIICQVFKLIKYPVSGWIFFRYPANPVSGWIVKITIRCTSRYKSYIYPRGRRARGQIYDLYPKFEVYNQYLFCSWGGFRTTFHQFQRLSMKIFQVLSTSSHYLFTGYTFRGTSKKTDSPRKYYI
jgi:hypothetical protein